MTDYYALAGIFTSTEDCSGLLSKMGGAGLDYYEPKLLVTLSAAATALPAVPADRLEKLRAEIATAKKAWEAIRGTAEGLKLGTDGKPTERFFRVWYERLQTDLLELTDPATRGFGIYGVREGKTVADTEVRIRGEAKRLGPTAAFSQPLSSRKLQE